MIDCYQTVYYYHHILKIPSDYCKVIEISTTSWDLNEPNWNYYIFKCSRSLMHLLISTSITIYSHFIAFLSFSILLYYSAFYPSHQNCKWSALFGNCFVIRQELHTKHKNYTLSMRQSRDIIAYQGKKAYMKAGKHINNKSIKIA